MLFVFRIWVFFISLSFDGFRFSVEMRQFERNCCFLFQPKSIQSLDIFFFFALLRKKASGMLMFPLTKYTKISHIRATVINRFWYSFNSFQCLCLCQPKVHFKSSVVNTNQLNLWSYLFRKGDRSMLIECLFRLCWGAA